jgi:hypothetical protein
VVMTPPHPATNAPAPETNPAPAAVAAPPTNAPPPPPEVMSPPAMTNVTATTAPENPGIGRGGLLAIACGVLVIAGVGCYMISRRSRRRGSPSLITESLKKK